MTHIILHRMFFGLFKLPRFVRFFERIEFINITMHQSYKRVVSLHEGHRDRVKSRFLNEGLDAFEDHQILELLLFYSIPRSTNELAQR